MTFLFANLGGLLWWPWRLHGPYADSPAGEPPPLAIEREILRLDCSRTPEELRPRCAFSASYTISNPHEEEIGLTAALFARFGQLEDIQVDALSRMRLLQEPEWQRLVDRTQEAMPGWPWPGKKKCKSCAPGLERKGVDLVLAPRATVELVARGTLDPLDPPHEFVYELAPVKTWGTMRQLRIEVRPPPGYRAQLGTFEAFGADRPQPSPLDCSKREEVTVCALSTQKQGLPSWLHMSLTPERTSH